MTHKSIELELRGEIQPDEFPRIRKKLFALGFRRADATRRVSVMFFGTVRGDRKSESPGRATYVDLRCRVTNGSAEIVTKIGKDVTNRLEISRSVNLDDLIAFSRMFAAMGFCAKVGSKLTENFRHGLVIVSLVRSPSGLAYIELEKMTDRAQERTNRETLAHLARKLNVRIWKSQKEFTSFCDRLTRQDDWVYRGSPAQVKRLQAEIQETSDLSLNRLLR